MKKILNHARLIQAVMLAVANVHYFNRMPVNQLITTLKMVNILKYMKTKISRSQEVPIAHVRNRTLVLNHVPQTYMKCKLLRRENGRHLELTLLFRRITNGFRHMKLSRKKIAIS